MILYNSLLLGRAEGGLGGWFGGLKGIKEGGNAVQHHQSIIGAFHQYAT